MPVIFVVMRQCNSTSGLMVKKQQGSVNGPNLRQKHVVPNMELVRRVEKIAVSAKTDAFDLVLGYAYSSLTMVEDKVSSSLFKFDVV